jgi:hypothetical protein
MLLLGPDTDSPEDSMRAALLRLAAVAALFFTVSCDRGVTAPVPASNAANRLLLGSPQTVSVVTRDTPLSSAVSASATIGAFGGQIVVPGTGLKVVVPPFAVTSPTTITVTALAGDQVAYEFEPHGKQFLVPLLITQNLVGTSAYSGGLITTHTLFGGYFASQSDLNPSNGTALVSEILGIALNLSAKTATFPVFHFSGYLIATD